MRITRRLIFFFFWLVLMLPLVQMNTGWIKVGSLKGAADPVSFPGFSIKGWFDGSFQSGVDRAWEERLGFRNWLIRYRNQIEYTVLRKANASGVIVGKQGYLFEKDYIRAWQGSDALGEYFWREKFRRLRMVSDTLQSMGVNLMVVLEPGKASFMPEKIPNRYRPSDEPSANYHQILDQADQRGISLLDLNQYFLEQRDQSFWPLFPKGGIHWSYAGMLACADTLSGFIHEQTRLAVPRIQINQTGLSTELRGTDDDLAQILNLAIKPAANPMGYPEWKVIGDTSQKPRVLAISDSFYFSFLNDGVVDSLFANRAFWYYNKTIYPESWAQEKVIDSIDIRREVESMDLIMIMVTERFWYKFDWDFTDRLFALYYPATERDYLYDYYRMIIRNYIWFDDVHKEAGVMKVPLTERLSGHAAYQFWVDDQKTPFPRDLYYYRMKIMTDPSWMQQIREKAALNQISEEKQLNLDAAWLVSQDSL